MTAEEVLAGAADILEQKGWLQGEWSDSAGRCCVFGALHAAGGGQHWLLVRRALQAELGLSHPDGDDIIGWNNTRGRVKEEVIAALRNSKRHIQHDPL